MFIKSDELVQEVMTMIEKKSHSRPQLDILSLSLIEELQSETIWLTLLKRITEVIKPTLIFSSTISIQEMMMRLLSAHSKVKYYHFFSGVNKFEEIDRILDSAGFLYTLPIWFSDTDFKCNDIHIKKEFDIIVRVQQ